MNISHNLLSLTELHSSMGNSIFDTLGLFVDDLLYMEIILASTSPYRKMLLDQINLKFIAVKPPFDEDAYKKNFKFTQPRDLCEELAKQKALSLKDNYPNGLIIGSDQLACLDDNIIGKPHSKSAAEAQLLQLQGKSHTLITSVCIWTSSSTFIDTVTTTLKMRSLNTAQIKSYVETDNPIDCAGSYKLEKAGICLFEKIETPDHSAIIGLPLISVTSKIIELTQSLPYQQRNEQ